MSGQKAFVLRISVCLVSFVLSACCVPTKSTQQVDVMPLHLVEVRQDMDKVGNLFDLEVFDTYDPEYEVFNKNPDFVFVTGNWTSHGNHPDLVEVDVQFLMLANAKSARETFLLECQRYDWDTDDFVFGGSEDNQYCISYTRTELQAPDGLCLQTGRYESFVVFQKGRLLITIHEYTHDRNSHAKDKAIKLLAEAVKK